MSRRSQWWRETATLLGLAGLLVTLVFSTLAARQSARDDKQQREAVQVGLITDLNARAIEAERSINDSRIPDATCEHGTLGRHDDATLRAALSDYDYLAWLFNTGTVKIAKARQLMTARLVDGWHIARSF
ncbi:MAG TPA: hypothetical protein VFZ89_14105, partial [Solirubrobacteraceae bacterium]